MLDVDGNEQVDQKEFLKVRPLTYPDNLAEKESKEYLTWHSHKGQYVLQKELWFCLFTCLCAPKFLNITTFNAATDDTTV